MKVACTKARPPLSGGKTRDFFVTTPLEREKAGTSRCALCLLRPRALERQLALSCLRTLLRDKSPQALRAPSHRKKYLVACRVAAFVYSQMAGLYASSDVCLQVVSLCAPGHLRIVGIKENDEELHEWSCDMVKEGDMYKIKDENPFYEKDSLVQVGDDTIEWPDGTIWKRLVCTKMQICLLRHPRAFYTPMLVYFCTILYNFFAEKALIGVSRVKDSYEALQAWRKCKEL